MNKHIQKALLGTSAAALVFATSCGGDDAKPDLLVGEWEIESLQGGSVRIQGGTPSSTYTFNFARDGQFGYCYSYFIDNVLQDKDCLPQGEWEWIKKNKSVRLIDTTGSKRIQGISEDIIFAFAEIDGDSFYAIVGADTDGDGDIDYTLTVIRGNRVGDAGEWTEMQP